MLSKKFIFIILSCFCLLSFANMAKEDDTQDINFSDDEHYILSTDDNIAVIVFNEEDLSLARVRITNNGTINLPLLGEVEVKGLNVVQVAEKITALLLDGYLKKPNVSVRITEYRPFYINGEVKKTGSYAYRKDLTVEKAVTLAGGFTERATKSGIILVREGDEEPLDDVTLKTQVRPGDVITIKESFF